jgi:hypothetical protein
MKGTETPRPRLVGATRRVNDEILVVVVMAIPWSDNPYHGMFFTLCFVGELSLVEGGRSAESTEGSALVEGLVCDPPGPSGALIEGLQDFDGVVHQVLPTLTGFGKGNFDLLGQ